MELMKKETNVRKIFTLSDSFIVAMKELFEEATAFEVRFNISADSTQQDHKKPGKIYW